MGRSQKANKYGTAVEYQMASEYGLDLARASWKDADGPDGEPHEIKAAMHEHADGQPGTFKLYREYHEKLQREDGYYVFAAYRIRGRGVEVLAHDRRHASRLPTLRWHGGGDHRGTEQAKVAISDVV
ncbi:hypothetical protein [Halobacterium litoreum]|uniref:Uncharacterized protein n=1 Tax=Halobacterium litoreum TaxID=2039234 RepID=A0ABD5NHV1_9EURY|nr:hypothetical protein [Halobacterium litoreum]UHH12416.1 hypothetical protein LT972_09625 [Halobacterium litoreum]